MKYLLTHFLLFFTILIFGQSQKEKDSLKILSVINNGLNEQDSITQLEIFKEALSISKKLKSDFGIFTSHNKIAKWKAIKYNTDSTITEYKKGLKDLSNNSLYNFHFLGQIGTEFRIQSNYDSAAYYHKKSIDFGQKVSKNDLIAKGHIQLGSLWLQKDDNVKSFKNYAIADSICNLDDKLKTSVLRAQIINYLGYNVRATSGYEKALDYYLKAKKLYEKLNKERGVQEVNIAIAQAYISMKKYKPALKLLNESVAYHAKYAPQTNPYSYGIIVRGFLFLNMKKFKEAEKDYKLYYNLAIENKNEINERRGLWYLADFYLQSKQLDKSEIYTKKAIKKCKETGDLLKELELIGFLISISKQKKKFKEAIQFYDEYILLNKKIKEKNILSKTQTLEAKYQTEKKQQEITLLKSQKKLAQQQKKNQRDLLLGGIVISSLAGLFFFFLYRNRQKTTKKLQEIDKAKSNFFANISHEFRTPLTLISGPIQKQLQKENLSNNERINFEMMSRNSNRLLSLVDQLLDISKIEAGSLQLKVINSELLSFIGSLTDSFTYKAKQKELNYVVNNDSTISATWFDKDVIEKIITNLLSNAIKYTPTKGSVVCNTFVKENQFYFEVKNTGKGLTKKEITEVFERFYQINSNSQGVGIGLALVKELVVLHKGTIEIDSTPNKWTMFRIILPVGKENFNANEFVKDDSKDKGTVHQKISETDIDNDVLENADNPILLIVDDNVDIRTYLGSLFKEEYTILSAENGQEGIDLAIKCVPDIIISDIMMPVKNGIELCNTLKVDERTSHIPIILLTAKGGEKNEIEGIKTGADDYITKPFNEELLRLRVQKLIENRKKLQQRYSQEVILLPKDIAVTSVDEQFLERLQKVMDEKLLESSFKMDDFSKAVGMSRMQLHRKLKALTGLSATEFIRTQRLKLAAQLLKKSEINVSQVGYSVGFNDHAYFSKCFKEVYGCTPTEYSKK